MVGLKKKKMNHLIKMKEKALKNSCMDVYIKHSLQREHCTSTFYLTTVTVRDTIAITMVSLHSCEILSSIANHYAVFWCPVSL